MRITLIIIFLMAALAVFFVLRRRKKKRFVKNAAREKKEPVLNFRSRGNKVVAAEVHRPAFRPDDPGANPLEPPCLELSGNEGGRENNPPRGNFNVSVQNLIVMRLMAEKNQPYNGYELLQTLMSDGFHFGKMNIFHRHERMNGGGDILFSLASAEEPGSFDLQRMGDFSCNGLTLFMQLDGQKNITKTFEIMLDAARQLADDLGGKLWDDRYQLLDQSSIKRWQERIKRYENSRYSYDLFE